jgi:hypothetical protein
LKLRIKDELKAMQLSPKVEKVVNGELKHLLEEHRGAQRTIYNYERATGRSKSQLLREAGEAEDRRHLLKVNGARENLLDIAARIRAAQKQIKEVERRARPPATSWPVRWRLSRPVRPRAARPRRN